jgi:hypothetical protein
MSSGGGGGGGYRQLAAREAGDGGELEPRQHQWSQQEQLEQQPVEVEELPSC